MDSDPVIPDQTNRGISAEPRAARPNPFDDADASSRKRRRTSPTDSPSAHDEATGSDLQQAIFANEETGHRAADSVMRAGSRVHTPQPPLQQPRSSDSPTEAAASSRVTLNLRNPTASKASSRLTTPESLSSHTDATISISDSVNDIAHHRPSHREHFAADDRGTSTPSSRTKSPPVELVPTQEDDAMVDFDADADAVEVAGVQHLIGDPMRSFPYHDGQEDLANTVNRLYQFLSTRKVI
jgi:ubiquitin carboxyl-terminal hydrolase 34